MSGTTMDLGGNGGDLDGPGSIRSWIPVILIREWTLLTVIYMNYPDSSFSNRDLFPQFQTQKGVSLPFSL